MVDGRKLLEKLTGPVTIAMIFRVFRTRNDLTLEKAAKKLKVTKGFLSNVETGKKNLSLRTALEYGKKMGEHPEYVAIVWLRDQAREAGFDLEKMMKDRAS